MNGKKADLTSIIKEFEDGYDIGKDLSPSVTFIGSARLKEKNKYYKAAHKLSYKLAKKGFNLVTGGGGGIMEAGNRGAYEYGKTKSIGFTICLPKEQKTNPYVNIECKFDHFYSRKYMLFNFCDAIVVFPGGFGTLDEFFEVLMLLQTKKLDSMPIYMYGKKFWKPMIKSIEQSLLKNEVINSYDLDRFILTNSIEKIVKGITKE